jgi:hypothetical protein
MASVPWCCIVPAALALSGVVSSVAGRFLGVLLLLAVSLVLFGLARTTCFR